MLRARRAPQLAASLSGTLLLAVAMILADSRASLAFPRAKPLSMGMPLVLVQGAASEQDKKRAPFAELNQALAAARAKLEELSKAAELAVAAGKLRKQLDAAKAENRRLEDEIATLRAELEAALQARRSTDARIAELIDAARQAAAKAEATDKQLVTMRWQNAQLNTALAQAEAARRAAVADAEQARRELAAKSEALERVASLEAELEAKRAEMAEVRHELATAKNRVAELETDIASAVAERQEVGEKLAASQRRLSEVEAEREEARNQARSLRDALARTTAELERAKSANGELQAELARWRAAASSATDAAKANLLAVEAQIDELGAAAAAVLPEAKSPVTEQAAPAGERGVAGVPLAAMEEKTAAAEQVPLPPAAVLPAAAPAAEPAKPTAASRITPKGGTPSHAAVEVDLDLIKSADPAPTGDPEVLHRFIADLPGEERMQALALLTDLGIKADDRGLMLTVPGPVLFRLNSDEIQPSAYDTLAKVAELISLYKDRDVLILGHTDASGEADYNKTLSERRARLVKEFLVDQFELDPTRLNTLGLGEEQPIASNDTLAGRQANRRVEVVISSR